MAVTQGLCPGKVSFRGAVVPTGDGSAYVHVQLNGLGLTPLPSSHKGTLSRKARQKGNHETPTDRLRRSSLGLRLCPQDMSSSGATGCRRPFLLWAPDSPPDPRSSASSPRAITAFSQLLLGTDTPGSGLYKPPAPGYWSEL